MKYKDFDSLEEQINNTLNVNALITVLNKKGLISSEEFIEAKQNALEEFKQAHPTLFND